LVDVLGAPRFENEDKTHQARLVHRVTWWTLGVVAVFLGVMTAIQPGTGIRRLSTIVVLAAVSLVVLAVNRRGRPQLASCLLVVAFIAILSHRAYTSGGVSAPAISLFVAFTMVAGLLLGSRGALATAAAFFVIGGAMVIAGQHGAIPAPTLTFSPLTTWIYSGLSLGIAVVIQWQITATLTASLVRAQAVIRERQEAESALRANEELLRDAIEFLPVAVAVYGADRRLMVVNRKCSELFGYRRDELGTIDRLMELSLSEEERRKVDAERTMDLDSGNVPGDAPPRSFTAISKDGRLRQIVVRRRKIGDRVLSVIEDISERLHAEETIRASEARFRSIIEQAPFGICLTRDGATLYVNPVFARMFGFASCAAAIGCPIVDLYAPEMRAEIVERIRRRAAGEPVPEDFQAKGWRRDNDSSFPMQVMVGAIELADGPAQIGFIHDITDRERNEAAIRASEARLRSIIEQAPLGLSLFRDGVILYANPFFARMFGYETSEHAVGIPVVDLHSPEMRPAIAERARLRRAGLPVAKDFQSVGLRVDGSRFPLQGYVGAIDLADGPAYIGFTIDITERQRSEAAIRASEERFRSIIEQAPFGLSIFRSGTTLYANAVFARMFGYDDPKQAMGVPVVDLHAPEMRPMVADRVRRRSAGEAVPSEYQSVGVRRDGSRFPMQILVGAIDLADGPAHVGFTLDITERLRAEEAIRASESRFRSIIEQAPIGMGISRNGTTLYINPVFARMFAFDSPDQAIGFPVLELHAPEKRLEVAERIRRRSVGEAVSGEHESLGFRRDGSQFPMQIMVAGVELVDGPAHIAFVLDITERKRNEDDLRKYRDHLEELVEQRSRELNVAKEAADHANRAKSEFLASMSHEIRTPLNAVLGFAQQLGRDASLGPAQRRAAEVINNSGEHLLQLITDILDMSRIEAGRVTSDPADFDLRVMCNNMHSMFLGRAREKGLTLELRLDPDLPRFVRTDERKLRQILINLLANAVKFTAMGGIILAVDWRDGMLRCAVTDTGPGMTADEAARLFKPFVQTLAGRRQGGGAGLGLALSLGFAQTLGGTLTVTSTVGVGTVFTLVIPVSLSASATRSIAARHALRLADGHTAPRVLVAEDHGDSRELLVGLMRRVGCVADGVGDGAAAVAACRDDGYDLVWMDIDMPVMDGLAAAIAIRALPRKAPMIIALTAAAFTEDRPRLLAGGCDEVTYKPYRDDDLFRLMERLLGIHFVWEQARPRPKTMPGLSDEELAGLWSAVPAADRARFAAALEVGDTEACIALVKPWSDPALVAALTGMLSSYDLARIHRLIADQEGRNP
jgi:PAS domain S-box-containing protein